MGCCPIQHQYLMENIEYSKDHTLNVVIKDSFGKLITRSRIHVSLPPPTNQLFSLIDLPPKLTRVSACVLPSFNAAKSRNLDCQDTFCISEVSGALLALLFDGHGEHGCEVTHFCSEFMCSYFQSNTSFFDSSPKSAIETMILACDAELKQSKIDVSFSGTTAVVIYLTSQHIHVGSVGDSRAVLATIPKNLEDPGLKVPHSTSKFVRPVTVLRKLQQIQLTTDHKPNHSQELRRIQNAGGEIRRIADDLGNPVGPYRIWLRNTTTLGLSISRAIGDKVASTVGVIPNPLLNSFKIYKELDQFIVIASDGVWDVMSNIEVVNFIERYRGVAAKEPNEEFPAKVTNSTIARLLCEEARFRWFGILENEDICVDDISCVVVEINNMEPGVVSGSKGEVEDRRSEQVFASLAVEGLVSLTRNKPIRNDAARGSTADETSRVRTETL